MQEKIKISEDLEGNRQALFSSLALHQANFSICNPCLYQAGLNIHSMYRSDCVGYATIVFNVADQLCFKVVEVFPLAYINQAQAIM